MKVAPPGATISLYTTCDRWYDKNNSDEGNDMLDSTTPLTADLGQALREVLTDALRADADPVARAGAPLYLVDLDALAIGDPIGELVDVVQYFGLDEDE